MFILNEKPISPDVAFEHEGIQYPANWIRLASPEERAAIGITEEPDPIPHDQRFYWDEGIPKDHAQLVEQWVGQVKQTAGTLLSQSDWYITRFAETGREAPQSVLKRRSEVRTLSNEKEAFLKATASTDELAAYVTGPEFNVWEVVAPQNDLSGSDSIIDTISFDTAITGSGIFGAAGEDTIVL